MLHVADFFRVPSVGLFGPASDRIGFGFRLGPHRVVSASSSMEAIDVGDVMDALSDLLILNRTK
jgi:ADP-heptose:LPS heptosyltransferase